MRILVADDNATGRELLIALLENRGHSVAGVPGGREALDALYHERFDIVFMDEEMPGMNGLEATRAILQWKTPGRKRPVIIGLSGNATDEDEHRCLQAGMDSFLTKPIGMVELYQVVDLFTPWPGPERFKQTLSAPSREPSQELAGHLRRATGGNEKLFRTLVKTFLADAPKTLSILRRAIERKDARAVATAAHSLKGSIGIFGADLAVAAARNLQAIGRAAILDGAAKEFRTLEDQVELLRRSLRSLPQAIPPQRKPPSKRTKRPRPQTSRPRGKR